MSNISLRGLYAITPDAPLPIATLVDQVGAAIAGGARVIQYRDKTHGRDERRQRAAALLACCRAAGVPLIVNDELDLAAELGADGVQLGRDDPDPQAARERLGETAIIGVSCYDQLALAEAAEAAGASYVAFGSFFPSTTKPHAVRPDAGLLTEARAATNSCSARVTQEAAAASRSPARAGRYQLSRLQPRRFGDRRGGCVGLDGNRMDIARTGRSFLPRQDRRSDDQDEKQSCMNAGTVAIHDRCAG